MIATGLGSRVLVAFAAFRMETGKPAVTAGDAFNLRCRAEERKAHVDR
jgi:hypothetical protein